LPSAFIAEQSCCACVNELVPIAILVVGAFAVIVDVRRVLADHAVAIEGVELAVIIRTTIL
jgi:hypothetical protein